MELDKSPLPGLVWAFRAYADGRAEELSCVPAGPPAEGWLWLHFDLTDARALAAVSHFDVPPPVAQLLVGADGHQQLHVAGPWIYGILTDLIRGLDGPTGEIGKLHFAMTDRIFISGRRHRLAAVEEVHQALRDGRAPPTTAGLLEAVVERVVGTIERYIEKLGRKLDRIEEAVLAPGAGDERQAIGRMRRIAVRLHRQLAGLRALFRRMEHEFAGEPPPAMPRLASGRLPQRLDWLDQEVIALRDRSHLLQEEVTIKIAERTNEHVRVLAIVTTVLLPPTLVSGIFGMNVKDLPLTEGNGGFWWAAAILLGSAAAVCFVLKRMGLIGRR